MQNSLFFNQAMQPSSKNHFPVFLNRFCLKKLNENDKFVYIYECNFETSPEQGKEFKAMYRVLWKLGIAGTLLGSQIITKEAVSSQNLTGEGWKLISRGRRSLDLSKESEKQALEKIERNWLGKELRKGSVHRKVENYQYGGFIWWDQDRIILKNNGWEVHTGFQLDIELTSSGYLFVEIDSHYRFYCPWTLSRWLQEYADIYPSYVRNIYDDETWQYVEVTDESPEAVKIATLGMSLADYHRNHNTSKATDQEIQQSKVIYVKRSHNNQIIPHLSARVRPILDLDILSSLAERGQAEAGKVFKEIRQLVQQRFQKSQAVAEGLFDKIYASKAQKPTIESEKRTINPQKSPGILLRTNPNILLTKTKLVSRTEGCFNGGCLRIGETNFGCLNLVGNGWDKNVETLLKKVAKSSQIEVNLESPKTRQDLPDGVISRKQFWQNWVEQGTQTLLVITEGLGKEGKMRLRREALEANMAIQFMRPNAEHFRAVNIVLGLLVKAKWQPVGLQPLEDENAAEIAIGFDAGTNKNLYYGTSAFAVLANGQSLGWELPETQAGERLSQQTILTTVVNIIDRFQKQENRLPKRILLLRDGLVQNEEFDLTIKVLKQEKIAVDILSVRKSGTGRMAIKSNQLYQDVRPGTAVLSIDQKTFRIVTSKAIAGGSSRPLQIVRYYGDSPLELLAQQVDRLSLLHPASGYASSRLPMVLHFADKMAKEVQRLGQISILQNLDREKIFFA